MLRASRFLFLLGCAFALLATSALAANTTKPKVPAPLGFDIYGSEFAFVSNDGWDLANGSPAKEVVTYRKKSPGAQDAYNRQDQMYIWARTCTPAAQKVVFTRTYDMPGGPTSVKGELWATNSGYAQGPSQGVVNIKVFINGKLIVTANGSKVTTASTGFAIPVKPKDFRKGINQIRIEVNKRAQSGFLNRCMYNGTPLGVRFALSGKFSTDLFLSLSSTPKDIYVKFNSRIAPLHVGFGFPTLDFRNRGPADANFARMTMTLGGEYVNFIQVGTIKNPKGPCEKKKRPITTAWVMDMACGINEINTGAHQGPQFRALYDFKNPPPQYAIVYMNASLSSRLNDPMFSNNQLQIRMHLCGPGAYQFIPKCPVWDQPTGAAPSEKAELQIE